MPLNAEVHIEGWKEFAKAVKKADPELNKELKRRGKEIAELVAADARGRAPKLKGKLAGSIKAGSTNKGAYVQGGKGTVPYFGWIDFGGQRKGKNGALAERPFMTEGRILFPALWAQRDTVEKGYEMLVRDMAEKVEAESEH